MTDRSKKTSPRGMWLVVALFALGGAFFVGLKISARIVGHPPATLPSTTSDY